MINKDLSVMNFLVSESDKVTDSDLATQRVAVETVDSFCTSENIDKIIFLKFDTEGSDMKVFKGAEEMLTTQFFQL